MSATTRLDRLESGDSDERTAADPSYGSPLVSVVVPAYDAEHFLERTLVALCQQSYKNIEILVVDDGSSDRTPEIVRARAQVDERVRLVQQINAGVAAARNQGIALARGEFIAPVDADDIWYPDAISRLVMRLKECDASVGVAYAWSADIDERDCQTGGFHAAVVEGDVHKILICHNFLGNASSTMIRRACFERVGGYDSQLRARGAQGCEDWDLYLRLAEHYKFVAVSEFLVGYRRVTGGMSGNFQTMIRSQEFVLEVSRQRNPKIPSFLYSLSRSSFYVFLAHECDRQGNARDAICWLQRAFAADRVTPLLRLGVYRLLIGNVAKILTQQQEPDRSAVPPTAVGTPQQPAVATAADIHIAKEQLWLKLFAGRVLHSLLSLLPRSHRLPDSSESDGARSSVAASPIRAASPKQSVVAREILREGKPMAVRLAELSEPLQSLSGLQAYEGVRIFAAWQGAPIGSVDLANQCQPVSAEALAMALATDVELTQRWEARKSAIAPQEQFLSPQMSVSVVLPTCDRPEDLRCCLQHLSQQQTLRSVEAIVVDNRPASGLTPPVVAEFPQAVLVREERPGASFARNAGVARAGGDIIVTLDDDVTPAANWLEHLLAPFVRPEVAAVTGNVLPLELETSAQQIFEIYADGGLSRGFEPFAVDRAWLESFRVAPPVWLLGGTANAAFRASIFRHPEIGLWEELLGAGVPAGGGEDIYQFYRILQAGFVHAYEPRAWVWHRHRRELPALRRQLFNYSCGVIAHHLMTLGNYRDYRLLATLALLPAYYSKRILWRLLGRRTYPIPLVLLEILGHSLGGWSLWRSRQHLRRHGRSSPTVLHSQAVHGTPSIGS